jgi:hypothetical protein
MSSKLKAITTKAKALFKTGKYKKWTDAIKAASKLIPTTKTATKKKAKVGAVKKKATPKKKAATKKKATTIHKDTKSHNVKVSVVSGVPKNKKYNLFAHIQKMNGNTERLHYFYFEKLNDAKKVFSKILTELKEKKDRGVYTIEIVNVQNLKIVKQLTWFKI